MKAWAVIGCLALVGVGQASEPVVETSLGKVLGKRLSTEKGNNATAFLAIPFADPPVGALRFRESRLFTKGWTGLRDGRDWAPDCHNVPPINFGQAKGQSEDCLYLNVMTTERCMKSKSCPVFVYLFGGAFVFGSPSELPISVDFLFSRTFVKSRYKMACKGDGGQRGVSGHCDGAAQLPAEPALDRVPGGDTPGNYFVHDQINALRWVEREVGAFGGLASQVTVSGCSSAAMSASLLTLTHAADSLFARSAHQSGSALNENFITNQKSNNASRDQALALGCIASVEEWTSKPPQDIVDCMRAVPAAEFVAVQLATTMSFPPPVTHLRIDDGPDGLFRGASLGELVASRVPRSQLNGLTRREWTGTFRPFVELLGVSEAAVSALLPAACAIAAPSYGIKDVSQGLLDACVEFYRGMTDQDAMGQLGQALSDADYNLPTLRDVQNVTKVGGTAYLYLFNYTGSNEDSDSHPAHADDLGYIFGSKMDGYDETDRLMERRYSSFIVDFVKFGAVDAEPLRSASAFNYLEFSLESTDKDGLYQAAYEFWFHKAPGLSKQDAMEAEEKKEMVQPLASVAQRMLSQTQLAVPPHLRQKLRSVLEAAGEGPSPRRASSTGLLVAMLGTLSVVGVGLTFHRLRPANRRHYQLIGQ